MTTQTNKQQTYTQSEVEELMRLALSNWNKHLQINIERLEKDEQFQGWAKKDNYKPHDYLYYAQDDTTIWHSEMIDQSFDDFTDRLKEQEKSYNNLKNRKSNDEITPQELLNAIRHVNRKRKSGGAA